MSSEFFIDKNLSKENIYKQIENKLPHLLAADDKIISNLSNFAATLKQCFDKISWVGFYIRKNDKLFLGPFQGKIACSEIAVGSGVCGTAANKRSTIIVENVEDFPGHIACDSESKSEIVIPIIVENELWGVLDIDSYELSAFGEIDEFYLEQFCKFLVETLSLKNFSIT